MSFLGHFRPCHSGQVSKLHFEQQPTRSTLNTSSGVRHFKGFHLGASLFSRDAQLPVLAAAHKNEIEANHQIPGNLKIKALPTHAITSRKAYHKDPLPTVSIEKHLGDGLLERDSKDEKKRREKKGFEDLLREKNLNYEDPEVSRLCTIDEADFIEMSTKSREGALSIQQHVLCCTFDCATRLARLAVPHLGRLIVHPTANYIVQRLIDQCSPFALIVASYCESFFKDLAGNQFASRVMQRLIECNEDFCSFALSIFRKDLSNYIHSFASVFLVSVAVKHARSEGERYIFRYKVIANMERYMGSKYFKRVVISFISACDQTIHGWVFDRIAALYPTSADFFKDRYSLLILVTFIEKEFLSIKSDLLLEIQSNPLCYLQEDLFLYFVQQISSKEKTIGFQRVLDRLLRSLPQFYMLEIQNKASLYSKFSQALILLSKKETKNATS